MGLRSIPPGVNCGAVQGRISRKVAAFGLLAALAATGFQGGPVLGSAKSPPADGHRATDPPPPPLDVRVNIDADAITVDYSLRKRELEVIVPRALGSLRSGSDDPAPTAEPIQIIVGTVHVNLGRESETSAALVAALAHVAPGLEPSGDDGRNAVAEMSVFARMSGELRASLRRTLPHHPDLGRALGGSCKLSCDEAGVRLIADGLAAAALLIQRKDDPDCRALVRDLAVESATATLTRVGLACPNCCHDATAIFNACNRPSCADGADEAVADSSAPSRGAGSG